jgi:hypothetical protein
MISKNRMHGHQGQHMPGMQSLLSLKETQEAEKIGNRDVIRQRVHD